MNLWFSKQNGSGSYNSKTSDDSICITHRSNFSAEIIYNPKYRLHSSIQNNAAGCERVVCQGTKAKPNHPEVFHNPPADRFRLHRFPVILIIISFPPPHGEGIRWLFTQNWISFIHWCASVKNKSKLEIIKSFLRLILFFFLCSKTLAEWFSFWWWTRSIKAYFNLKQNNFILPLTQP